MRLDTFLCLSSGKIFDRGMKGAHCLLSFLPPSHIAIHSIQPRAMNPSFPRPAQLQSAMRVQIQQPALAYPHPYLQLPHIHILSYTAPGALPSAGGNIARTGTRAPPVVSRGHSREDSRLSRRAVPYALKKARRGAGNAPGYTTSKRASPLQAREPCLRPLATRSLYPKSARVRLSHAPFAPIR